MSYCINPDCQNPHNSDGNAECISCGSSLLLKNRYQAVKPLGQSIYSRTFLAKDRDKPANTRCVIKQFVGQEGVSDLVARSSAENSKFSGDPVQLDKIGKHSQIPELLAAFEEDGHYYLIQEYVEGPSLAAALEEEGVFGEAQVWEILGQVLPVLDYMHDRQVVHGDIKPDNIICRDRETRKNPELVLVDFGASCSGSAELQPMGTMNGSAEYVAPEQTRGVAYASSDLYSLGVTCIHLLTEVPTFDLFDVKTETWVWRDYLKKPVSSQLGRILDKLIERNPKQRYKSTKQVLADLKYGPTYLEAFLQKPKYALSIWAGAAIALLSLVISSRMPSPSPQTSFELPEPVSNNLDSNFKPPKLPESEITKIQPLPEFPNTNIDRPLRTLANTSNNVWSVAVSPSSPIVASGGMNGTIEILHLHTGKTIRTLPGHYGPVWSIAISSDGKTLVSAGGDGTVKVWNLYSGALEHTLHGHTKAVFSVAIAPNGQTIASGSKDKTIKLWDVRSGLHLETLYGHLDEVQSVAFSPNGETLVSGSNDATVKVWNWRYAVPVKTFKGHDAPVWAVAISPDGQTVASGSWDNTIKLWELNSREYRRVSYFARRTLVGHSQRVQSLAFSSDGDTLASGDFSGTINLWNLNNGKMKGTLKGHNSWVDLTFDPLSQNLISGSFDDTIKVWRLPLSERF